MTIPNLYRQIKQILEDSNIALVNKGLNRVTSLSGIANEIKKINNINKLNYYLSGDITELSAQDLDGATCIGNNIFQNNSNLTSVTIPDSVTSISNDAFSECDNLTSVTIPDSVTSIGDRAFANCNSLVNITIPDSVITIGLGAINNTAYYNNANNWNDGVLYCGNHLITSTSNSPSIREGILCIADGAFRESNPTSITLPDSITTIGAHAFSGCTNLTSITIPDSVLTIGGSAFYWCENLANITIPDSVTIIGDGAFSYCKSLRDIVIPSSVTSIGKGAFEGCDALWNVYIYSAIPPAFGGNGLYPMFQSTAIHVPIGSGDAYKSATNWSYFSSKIVEDIVIE